MAIEVTKARVRIFRDVKRNTMTAYVEINDIKEQIRFGFADVIDENISEFAVTQESQLIIKDLKLTVDYHQNGVYLIRLDLPNKFIEFYQKLDTTQEGLIMDTTWRKEIEFDEWLVKKTPSKLKDMLASIKGE